MNQFSTTLILTICIVTLVGVIQYASAGTRTHSDLESIDGISYPIDTGAIVISEKLAHTDVYLHESVFGKKLILDVTFDPGNLDQLDVGVRENSFWLSYSKVSLWKSGDPVGRQTKQVSIPLTDKIQETDQSIDVMFFAHNPSSASTEDEGIRDATLWRLYDLSTKTVSTWPATNEVKDFVRGFINRERTL